MATAKCLDSAKAEAGPIDMAKLLGGTYAPFAIIGISSSGKTLYAHMVLHTFRQRPTIKLINKTAIPLSQSDLADYNALNDSLFSRKTLPESNQQQDESAHPWTVESGTGRKTKKACFTLLDYDGEKVDSYLGDSSSSLYKQAAAAKGFIILIDPLSLPEIRTAARLRVNMLGADNMWALKGNYKNGQTILDKVLPLIKNAVPTDNLDGGEKLNRPVAIVFTKFDVFYNLFDKGINPIETHANLPAYIRGKKLDMKKIENDSAKILSWLEVNKADNFQNTIESSISDKNICYFAVSSLGQTPDDGVRLRSEPRPHLVLNPILWLFERCGFF